LRRTESGKIPLRMIPGVGDANAEVLAGQGFEIAETIMNATDEQLSSVTGFSFDQMKNIRNRVLLYTEERARTLSSLKNRFRHEVDSMEFIDTLTDRQLELLKIPGVGLKLVRHLKISDIETVDDLLKCSSDDLASKLALSDDEAALILQTAKQFIEKREAQSVEEKLENLKALEQGILDMSLDEQPEDELEPETKSLESGS